MGHLWWLHSNLGTLSANVSQNVCSKDKYLLVLVRRGIREVKNDQTGQKYIFQKFR